MIEQQVTSIETIGAAAAEDVTRFDRAEPDAHFALPTHPTCGQQMDYYSLYAETPNELLYRRMWHSAQVLILDWECAVLPDRKINVDQIRSPEQTTVMMWAGNAVLQHMNDLETLPKA